MRAHRIRDPRLRTGLYVAPAVVLLALIAWAATHRPKSPHVSLPPVALETTTTTTTLAADSLDNVGGSVTLKWPRGRPLNVLFVGDSITQGRITTDAARDYVSRVTAALKRHGPVATTVDWKSGAPVEYWMRQTFPANLDLAIVEVGTNEKSVPEPVFNLHYVALIDKIEARSPRVKTVCLSMWRPDQSIPAFKPINDDILYDCGGAYVDINSAAHVKKNIAAEDHFHPNDAGHAAIATSVLDAIDFS